MKIKNIVLTLVDLILIIVLTVLLGLSYRTVKAYACSYNFYKSILEFQENNSETVFTIDKITYFSSSDALIETNSNSSFTISDLFQYTDIAIFINPNSEALTEKNTLKSVNLRDFEYSLKPSLGTQRLYYKNIYEFTNSNFSTQNIIDKSITFETTSSEDLDYSKPILFNNCANPISLCYVNSNIVDTYTLDEAVANISHDGSILKSCGVTLNSISCKIKCIVDITNNLDEVYTCPITLNIPISTEEKTIYDGSLTYKDDVNYVFVKK